MVPASETGATKMSQALSAAYACGWSLATTLMVYVVVFRAGDDDFGVMTTAEYDGDPDLILQEFDPHQS
jgi:hypothetical protein